jgi:opacity protein-like surface antigen
MKKITLFTIAILSTLFSVAQDFQKFKIAPRVSPGIAWLKPDSKYITNEGNVFRLGFGLSFDRQFTENYAIGTGLEITRFGGELTYKETGRVNGQDLIWQTTRTYDLRYVEIPLSLKLRTNEIGYITYWGQFGLITGFNIRSKADDIIDYELAKVSTDASTAWIKTDLPSLDRPDEDIKDDIQMFRVGLLVGAGIEYSLSGNTAIVAGVTYNNGFTNTLRGDHVQTDEADEVVFENQKPRTTKLKAMSNLVSLNVGIKF